MLPVARVCLKRQNMKGRGVVGMSMNHLGTKVLETERLILRPFRETDSEDMYNNWACSDHVTKYLTWPPHSSIEVTKEILELWISSYGDQKNYQWCVEWKENHQAIGSIGIVHLDDKIDAVEIGYCIGEAYWNRGITTEALKAIIRFLFEEVGCNRISARHDTNNPNSGRVMKKAGLLYEGTLLEADLNKTGICDMVVYGITRKLYQKKKDKKA